MWLLYRLNRLPLPPSSVALQSVCAKHMYDKKGNKKDTIYQCEAYTPALQFGMTIQTEEDAMVYPQHVSSSRKRSLQKAMNAAAQGVPYRCCVTAFQWQTHSMVRCLSPNKTACVLFTHQVCEQVLHVHSATGKATQSHSPS